MVCMRMSCLPRQTNVKTFLEFFCYMLFLVDRELRKSFVSICAAEFFHDRTEVQCLHRWQKVLNPELIKGPWTQEVCNCSFDFTFREKETAAFFIHAKFLEEDVISVSFSTGR